MPIPSYMQEQARVYHVLPARECGMIWCVLPAGEGGMI